MNSNSSLPRRTPKMRGDALSAGTLRQVPLPCVKRLAIDLVDTGLRDRHRAGRTFHEKVHVINRPVSPDQIYTREVNAAAEVGQILQMDADEFQIQFLLVECNLEVSAACLGLLGNMF